MTLSTQAKILRVLQEGSFERVGGEQTLSVDVRVIAATNRNLEKAIEEGKFREDLYYRVKVVTITLPPLRLRNQDISDLANYFLEKHSVLLNQERITLSPEALEVMQSYHWPGNIREMENVIRRAIVLCKGNVIPAELINEEFQQLEDTAKILSTSAATHLISKKDIEQYQGKLYEKMMSETERHLILQVLKVTSGNQVKAAKILGVSRVMLRDRIKKYEIRNEIIIDTN